jgi:hypothetical protein
VYVLPWKKVGCWQLLKKTALNAKSHKTAKTGAIWGRFFVHFFPGKFSPKNVGKKLNFPQKKF